MNRCVLSFSPIALAMAGFVIGGCARPESAKTTPTMRADSRLVKPDLVVVEDFAVEPEATAMGGDAPRPTEEEVRVGRMVAESVAYRLVVELNAAGIKAARGGPGVGPGAYAATLSGQFVSGPDSAIGFRFGAGEHRLRIQVVQGGRIIATASTTATSGLDAGNADDRARIRADADRIAVEVGRAVRQAYVERGWLPR